MKHTCRHCGAELSAVTDARCYACNAPLDLPTTDTAKGTPEPGPVAPSAGHAAGHVERSAAARWLPLVWIVGGGYLLVRSGWPPRVPVFTVAAGAAIAIGIGMWFIERHPAFRPWRPLIRYALLGTVLAALVATIAWDIARQAGR